MNNDTNSISCAEDVVAAAAEGDLVAESVLDDAAKYLAIGCLNIARLLDPDSILIGGGIAAVFLPRILHWYKKLNWKLHDDLHDSFIRLAVYENGVVGAAILADEYFHNSK